METIDTETAEELALGYDVEPTMFVASELDSEHRWYNRMLIVFSSDGELFGFYYDKPATEIQEGMDVFEADPVPVFPVVAQKVERIEYLASR